VALPGLSEFFLSSLSFPGKSMSLPCIKHEMIPLSRISRFPFPQIMLSFRTPTLGNFHIPRPPFAGSDGRSFSPARNNEFPRIPLSSGLDVDGQPEEKENVCFRASPKAIPLLFPMLAEGPLFWQRNLWNQCTFFLLSEGARSGFFLSLFLLHIME